MKLNSIKPQVDGRTFWWAVGLSVVGCFLLVASLFIPPLAVIDPSVISAAGLLFTFAGALVGITSNFNTKLVKFETEMDRRYPKANVTEEESVEGETQNKIAG